MFAAFNLCCVIDWEDHLWQALRLSVIYTSCIIIHIFICMESEKKESQREK